MSESQVETGSSEPATDEQVITPPQPDYVTLGKLSFPASARTAAKSTDLLVFQGLYNKKSHVTIKRAKKHLRIVDKEVLIEIRHPNIVRYYTTEADDDF